MSVIVLKRLLTPTFHKLEESADCIQVIAHFRIVKYGGDDPCHHCQVFQPVVGEQNKTIIGRQAELA